MEYVLIGNHPSIQKIRELITMVSDTAFSVLVMGETGTGKEVVARLLHQTSNRCNNNFIKINCSALPLTLLESELFGYEKGAFTGAVTSKPGKFELASDGVIFLDEIGDMPLSLQAKLLQVVQSGEFTRLGGIKDVKVNSWVISATNHDLVKDMEEGRFRKDLYYRLNIIKIEIPPLQERKEDLPLLMEHLIQKHRSEFQISSSPTIDSHLQKLLLSYHWPGNVRELSGVILRLVIGDDPEGIRSELENSMLADGLNPPIGFMQHAPLSSEKSESKDPDQEVVWPLKELKAEASKYIEKRIILYALNQTRWHKSKVAKMLQISYKALFYKMNDYGIRKSQKPPAIRRKEKPC
jgi:transcriptional regulator with PAS, ATPase and Fis domain